MTVDKRVREKISFKQNEDITACWIWNGFFTPEGVAFLKGGFSQGQTVTIVHSYLYKEYKGELFEGEVLYRLCEEGKCVNPNHWGKR